MGSFIPKQKAEGYEENFAEDLRVVEEGRVKGRAFLAQKSLEAAETIYQTMKDPEEPKLRLDAAKEILKVNGFYVDQVQHSGEVSFTPLSVFKEKE